MRHRRALLANPRAWPTQRGSLGSDKFTAKLFLWGLKLAWRLKEWEWGGRVRPSGGEEVMKGHVAHCDKCSPDLWFITVWRGSEQHIQQLPAPASAVVGFTDACCFYVCIHLFTWATNLHTVELNCFGPWVTFKEPSFVLIKVMLMLSGVTVLFLIQAEEQNRWTAAVWRLAVYWTRLNGACCCNAGAVACNQEAGCVFSFVYEFSEPHNVAFVSSINWAIGWLAMRAEPARLETP